ncbi:helix-turn-helix domain-containing protein [Streptomyces sp. NPDC058534]|uniref:helix-turn-helix domain-containing protein n=1 Tax=Streptomyces sp. NPDC058534 TaxID=3346541 RepID=UPI00365467EF
MIGTVFRTNDVPVGDRFEYWCSLVGRTRPSDMSSAHTEDFRAELLMMELGQVKVWPTSTLPTRYRLSPKESLQAGSNLYHLTLLFDRGLTLEYAGSTHTFAPRDLHMVDDSQPYDLQPTDEKADALVTGVGVDFPKTLLPLPENRVRPLLGQGLSGREGMGAILAGYLTGLAQEAKALQPRNAAPLGAVVIDLVSAWLAQVSETNTASPREIRRQILLRQIEAFICQNLHDPELSPRNIAAAHHISVSYLHRIFEWQKHGETVAASVRRQRLEGARHDLDNPTMLTTPIHTIGELRGFLRASEFSRAFKMAYGISPRKYRMRSLRERE